MLVFILALLYEFSAEKIYQEGALITQAGMLLQAFVHAERFLVTLAVFIFSTGDHMQLGMRNTLALEYSHTGHGGSALGFQNSAYQFGTLAGYIVLAIVFYFFSSRINLFRPVFIASLVIIATGFMISCRFYFRKKYAKFYMLEVFYEARKQIFFTFGPYLLVLFYGAGAMAVSILFALSAIACFICAPLVGKIIDRFGYKIVMVIDTLILVIVCFFYGFAHHLFSMHTALILIIKNYFINTVYSK